MSLNMTGFLITMLTMASSFFNALIPVIALLLGITVGIGLAFMVYRLLANLFPSS
jgi:formate-dependent nitrite reductase membrane component NrfD